MSLESATESTLAKAMTRFGMPILLALLGTVCGLLLQDIRSAQQEQGKDLQKVTGDVQVLNAKMDNGVIWRITEIERRLNTVENAQKTP